MNILLVDDNPLMQQLLVRFLGDLGYNVVAAGRADEALALADAQAPALFLLDMYLPDMDGPDALQALRKIPGCAATPAIAMSGLDESAIRPAILSDFVAYLSKPIDLDLLETTVAQHVGPQNARSVGRPLSAE